MHITRKWMRTLGDKTMSINNSNKKRTQYIDGLMLGDGCIHKQHLCYQQMFAYRYAEWALKIQSDFDNFGIESTLMSMNSKDSRCKDSRFKNGEFKIWLLQTIGDVNKNIFPFFRDKWYNGRMIEKGNKIIEVKTVPPDIDLMPPQLLALWYMGDGCYCKRDKWCRLCTEGFTSLEVLMLHHKLNKVLLMNTRIDTRNHIRMTVADSRKFLDYTKDFKVNCFAYKWGKMSRKEAMHYLNDLT